jgi:SAM-dependent methyltransferase
MGIERYILKPSNDATCRLRASPGFALTFTLDGRPYVAKDTEPYIQYWLSERDRVVLSLFSGRHGATSDDVVAGYFRLLGHDVGGPEVTRVNRSIRDLRAAGVLIDVRDDTSRYTHEIVQAYVAHRPFPQALSDRIIQSAPITKATRVLDLAGGPGDLALALARASDHVALMDLSKGFVNAAARRARQLGLKLEAIHDSGNRLVFRDDEFEVVTISQALHWLDDVLVCKGLCRMLSPGGSFFVMQGAFEVDDDHPLAYLLGRNSILGHKARQSFAAEALALLRRLTLLFDALDSPDVQRIDLAQRWGGMGDVAAQQIVPADFALYRQQRPMDLGFVRAFLTPEHIAVTGQDPAVFWAEVERRCAAASAEQLLGRYDWSMLHFRRGGVRLDMKSVKVDDVLDIAFEPRG